MKKIPRNARNKRTQFFGDSAIDPVVTMATEMMAELWVVKERMFVLEKVLDESGIDVSQKIEGFAMTDDDTQKLEIKRRQFVENIMRAFEAQHVERESQQRRLDELTASMKEADQAAENR